MRRDYYEGSDTLRPHRMPLEETEYARQPLAFALLDRVRSRTVLIQGAAAVGVGGVVLVALRVLGYFFDHPSNFSVAHVVVAVLALYFLWRQVASGLARWPAVSFIVAVALFWYVDDFVTLTVLLVVFGLPVAILRTARTGEPEQLVRTLIECFCFWLACLLLRSATHPLALYLLLFAPAVAVTIYVAERIAEHLVRWHLSAPDLKPEFRQSWSDQWANRYKLPEYRLPLVFIATVGGLGLVLLAVALAIPAPWPLMSSLSVLCVLGALVALPALLARQGDGPWQALWHQFARAGEFWLTHESHPSAPGVVRVPVRLPFMRYASTEARPRISAYRLAVGLLTMAVLPAAAYFPVTMVAPAPWLQAASSESLLDLGIAYRSDRGDALSNLSPLERRYAMRLDDGEFRDYRRARSYLLARGVSTSQVENVAFTSYINAAPEAWVPVALTGFTSNLPFFLWTAFFSALLCFVAPLLLFHAVGASLTGPLLLRLEREAALPAAKREKQGWEAVVETILASQNPFERDSLYIGVHHEGEYPVFLHRKILHEHAHILGDSGSGKSSLALAPMIAQTVRMAARDLAEWREGKGSVDRLSSTIVIDLKGDKALFHGARIEAERAGLPFRWFCSEMDKATFAFNPLQQPHLARLSPNQLAEVILQALSLSHGEGYGRKYFSVTNRRILTRVLQAFRKDIHSFRDLHHHLEQAGDTTHRRHARISERQWEDAGELFATVETLAAVEPLVSANPAAEGIDVNDVFETPQVLYFYLPAGLEAGTVSEIGRLVLFSLLSASIVREGSDKDSLQAYLFVDEFQQIISENLQLVLRQARSKRIAMILANQTISDLRTASVDLVPSVQANTRFKQYFATSDVLQQDLLMRAGGETVDLSRQSGSDHRWGDQGESFSRSQGRHETVGPRLTRNILIKMTDDPSLSVAHVTRGLGYAQFGGFPFLLESTYHISEDQYLSREKLPWPKSRDHPGTIVVTVESLTELEQQLAQGKRHQPQIAPGRGKNVGQGQLEDLARKHTPKRRQEEEG